MTSPNLNLNIKRIKYKNNSDKNIFLGFINSTLLERLRTKKDIPSIDYWIDNPHVPEKLQKQLESFWNNTPIEKELKHFKIKTDEIGFIVVNQHFKSRTIPNKNIATALNEYSNKSNRSEFARKLRSIITLPNYLREKEKWEEILFSKKTNKFEKLVTKISALEQDVQEILRKVNSSSWVTYSNDDIKVIPKSGPKPNKLRISLINEIHDLMTFKNNPNLFHEIQEAEIIGLEELPANPIKKYTLLNKILSFFNLGMPKNNFRRLCLSINSKQS